MLRSSDTILIVDDSPNDALLFSVALEQAGIRNPLIFTSNFDQTVEFLLGRGDYGDRKRYPFPSLIFLDFHMPKVSGIEVLTWLRATETTKNVTVIMMSGAASERDVQRALSLGADYYLTKPIAAQDLIDALRHLRENWLEMTR